MTDTYNKKTSTSSTLEGFFKTRYGQLHKLCPTQFTLQRHLPFSESEQLGDKFIEVALLQNEHGVCYAGSGEDAFHLADAVAAQTKPTEIQGSQHVLKVRIGYNAIKSAKKRGETAFQGTMDTIVANSNDSLRKRVEIDMFWGQDSNGLAPISSVASNTITIAAAQWSPGIWAGSEGAVIAVLPTALSSVRGTFEVSQVNIANRQVIGSNTNRAVSDVSGIQATDILLFGVEDADSGGATGQHNGTSWKTQLGLYGCMTASSTLFGISTNYSVWKPSSYSAASSTLTFSKVQKALYQVISRGFKGDMLLLVNPTTWADILDDEVALRRHTGERAKQYTVGAEGIKFFTATGVVRIEASIYMKEGFAMLIPEAKNKGARWRRIGATDVGFDTIEQSSPIERVADTAAFEFRLYDNQAIYSGRPGYSCYINNIVNAT